MEYYNIVKYPTPILRLKTKKIEAVTDEHRRIFENMSKSMYKNNGIGLAAPQVGLGLKLAVIDAGEGLLKIVNPAIINFEEGFDIMEEGCLSIPEILVNIKRHKNITIEYKNEWGKIIKKNFYGLTAKAIQHEIDHLNGRLIIDYLPWYKRIFKRKYVRRKN